MPALNPLRAGEGLVRRTKTSPILLQTRATLAGDFKTFPVNAATHTAIDLLIRCNDYLRKVSPYVQHCTRQLMWRRAHPDLGKLNAEHHFNIISNCSEGFAKFQKDLVAVTQHACRTTAFLDAQRAGQDLGRLADSIRFVEGYAELADMIDKAAQSSRVISGDHYLTLGSPVPLLQDAVRRARQMSAEPRVREGFERETIASEVVEALERSVTVALRVERHKIAFWFTWADVDVQSGLFGTSWLVRLLRRLEVAKVFNPKTEQMWTQLLDYPFLYSREVYRTPYVYRTPDMGTNTPKRRRTWFGKFQGS